MRLNVKGTQIALSKMLASGNEYAMQIASVSSRNNTLPHLSAPHMEGESFSLFNKKFNYSLCKGNS